MREALRKGTGFIAFGLKAILYLCLTAVFFIALSFYNPQILRLSRTSGVTLLIYCVVAALLTSVYGGFDIGKQKSKPLIYATGITFALTDIIAYAQLLIMNVNDQNRDHFMPLPGEVACLAGGFLVQLLLIFAFAYLGNAIYFRLNPPESCCIVTSSNEALQRLLPKVEFFKLQYRVDRVAHYKAKHVYKDILKSDTVFLYEIPSAERTELMEFCYRNSKNLYFGTEVCDIIGIGSSHAMMDDLSFMTAPNKGLTLEQRLVKRIVDLLGAIAGTIIFSPVLLVCALAIWLEDKGPVFFFQDRVTRGGKLFKICKFRTMTMEGCTIPGPVVPDDPRISRVGNLLRRFRLDEFPQLYNVLKGEMSLVGPRPEVVENVEAYTKELPEFAYRLQVKAGITGYAQIAGKYNTLPKDKMLLDLFYIENYSLWLDIKMIFRTLTVWFKKDSTQAFGEGAQARSKFTLKD